MKNALYGFTWVKGLYLKIELERRLLNLMEIPSTCMCFFSIPTKIDGTNFHFFFPNLVLKRDPHMTIKLAKDIVPNKRLLKPPNIGDFRCTLHKRPSPHAPFNQVIF